MSSILDVPVQFFFDDMVRSDISGKGKSDKQTGSFEMIEFLSSPDGAQLVRTFSEIESPEVRRNILDLVKSVSGIGNVESD